MLLTIVNATVILFALSGILYLLFFGVKTAPAKDRNVMYAMVVAILLSFLATMFFARNQEKKVLLTIELVYAFTIWSVAWLSIRFRNALTKAELKHKEYLETLLEGCDSGVVIVKKMGDLVTANTKARLIFDCRREDELHKKVQAFIEMDNLDPDAFSNENEGRYPDVALQSAVEIKSSNTAQVRINKQSFTWEKDEFDVLFIDDVPLPPESPGVLEGHREFHEILMDITPMFMLTIGSGGRILYMNKYGKKLLGAGDVIGRDLLDFIPDEMRPEAVNFFMNPRTVNLSFTCPVTDSDHNRYIVRWRCAGVKHLNDLGYIYVFAGEDVTTARNEREFLDDELAKALALNEELETKIAQRTQELKDMHNNLHNHTKERKHIENELLNSQRLYNTLASNFPNGVIGVLNKDLRYVLVDGKELERRKMKAGDLIGHKIFEIYPDVANVYESRLRKAFADEEKISFDAELAGSIYNIIAVPLPDMQHDEVNEILVMISNITQWKRLEEDLHRAIAQEKDLVELKSRFVTMASHEFRTPLGTILSSVFLLERYNDSGYEEKRTIHINRIKKTVNNLTEVLNDFLSLGKLEEGKIQILRKQTSIVEIIKEVVKEMRSVKKPDQRIEYTIHGLHKPVMLDPHLLHNILMNLISNAIKYSPVNGVITVTSELVHEHLRIYVVDQGLGILEEDQPHIFERFFRSKNATNIDGTGLGLHIVKKYVELMHGSIDFTSDENGTTFKVIVPIE